MSNDAKLENVGAILTPGRMSKSQNGRRCKTDDTAFAITSSDVNGVIGQEEGKLRIRYLTPRECLRLMGFHETEIDKLTEAVPSKTNLYKLAGNSIVVDCLEAIFKSIYIDRTFDSDRKRQKSLDGFFTRVNPVVGRSAEEVESEAKRLGEVYNGN